MTRSEAIKAFFIKSVLPVAAAMLLYFFFKSACMKDGELDYVWLWILCGLPFGLHRMCLWIIPGGGSFGGGLVLFALNFILGGVIGAGITWTVIKSVDALGPAKSALLIVIAQLAVSYLIELFGLFGMDKAPLDWRKLGGLVLAVIGIAIFQWE